MRNDLTGVWQLTAADRAGPGAQHILAFVMLTIIGTVVGTLGTVGLPVGLNVSAFWPAMTLQAVGGIWFGGWGVLAGVVFACLTNLLTGGSFASVVGFIPANMTQGLLVAWVFRRWRLHPALPGWREAGIFAVVGCFLANGLGALLGIGALALEGNSLGPEYVTTLLFSWVMGNGLPCLALGLPLLWTLSPLVVDSPFFCKRWWGGSRPLHLSRRVLRDSPVVVRLLFGFLGASVVPILAISIAEAATLQGKTDASTIVLPVMLNVSIFLSLIVSGAVARYIARRVGTLAEGTRRLGAGDLDYRVPVESQDEIGALAAAFNQMAGDLIASRAELQRTTAERERYLRELEIAHGIQQSFLPQSFPRVPGYDVAARTIPARHVGGDFYDFIPLREGRWGMLVADVSDKGVPAALFMALSRSLVRAYSLEYENVLTALRAFNAFVVADNPSGMFVTLFYATLDPETHRLTYVNAGHNPPILLQGRDHQVVLLRAHGIALGVWPDVKLDEHPVQLEPGDVVVLYTDGVTEAFNADRAMFDVERLTAVVRANPQTSASEIVRAIENAVVEFTAGQPQSDDITLLVIRCCLDGPGGQPAKGALG